jgi:hypothetical protein
MKRLILFLLAMVIGLFTVGTARADGAWVLWEVKVKGPHLGVQPHQSDPTKWIIVGAYPSYDSCIEAEKFSCGSVEDGCRLCEGGHYRIDKTLRMTIYWKCFPESVDPRK